MDGITRRRILRLVGTFGLITVAGCSADQEQQGVEPTPTTATPRPLSTDTPTSSPDTETQTETLTPTSETATDTDTPTLSPGTIEGAWTEYQYDGGNTSFNPDVTGPKDDPEVIWSRQFSTKTFSLSSSPTQVLAGNTLYVGDYAGTFYALNASTGQERWSYSTSGTISSTPVVRDSSVYLATDNGTVHAISRTDGTTVWTSKPTGAGEGGYLTAAEGRIYGHNGRGEVYALDRENGEKVWGYGSSPSNFVVDSETVYISSEEENTKIVALDPLRGSTKWEWSKASAYRLNPSFSNGSLFIGAGLYGDKTGKHNIYAVNAENGAKKWSTRVGEQSTALGVRDLAVQNDTVYALADVTEEPGSVFLYAVDRSDGKQKWKFRTGDNFTIATTSDTAYVGGRDRRVYAINTDAGTLRWSHRLGEYILSILVAERTAFIGTRKGELYVLHEPN